MATFSAGYSGALGDILSQVNDAFSGKSSGIDVSSVVNELMQVEDQPETQMQSEQTTINSQISALTSIGSQLSTLASSVQSLSDLDGAFSQMTTGSSDSTVVDASADSTATPGTHTVVVSNLATTSSSYSAYIPSNTSLAGAQIVVDYGSNPNNPVKTDTINIPSSDTTLQQAASYINGAGYGVTANVVTDSQGSRLVLVSNTSGANGNLTVTSSATTFTSAAGVDAQLTVDGVPVDSASNTVIGAIPGVTLSLGAASPNTSVLISVEPDATQASTAIQNFVTAYNAVVGSINSQYTLDSSGNEGVLAGDGTLQTLQNDMLNMIASTASGAGPYTNLQSLGIEMQNDGTLQINSSTLSNALSNNYSEVQSFFQSTSGWGQLANTEMTHLTDPTLGPVAADINGLNQTNDDLSSQISDFQANMTSVQQQLTTQYNNLNALLIDYPLQMQEAADQLASLPGASSSSNSSSSV